MVPTPPAHPSSPVIQPIHQLNKQTNKQQILIIGSAKFLTRSYQLFTQSIRYWQGIIFNVANREWQKFYSLGPLGSIKSSESLYRISMTQWATSGSGNIRSRLPGTAINLLFNASPFQHTLSTRFYGLFVLFCFLSPLISLRAFRWNCCESSLVSR